MILFLLCLCYLPLQCGTRQMMCGSEVERKKRQQEFNSTIELLILFLVLMLLTSYSVAETDDVW